MDNPTPRGPVPAVLPHAPSPALPARSRRTAREHVGLAVLAAERAGRGALARIRRSRLLRWRYRSPAADELLLAPPDLRAADASFADEVAAGSFGLAGRVGHLGGLSPFTIAPPSPEWARELFGFAWLRHLDAAGSADARAIAHTLVGEWLRRNRRWERAWEPQVVGRRIVSWLSHASLLLAGVERRRYAAVLRSLTDQISYLSASWRNAPDGYPRLIALTALVHADLCIAGYDRRLTQAEKLLAAELERQISPDGGHLSRDPRILVELLLDLLPLRQCFAARARKPEPSLLAAVDRMTAMLRHLRLGDGMLVRFNGVGAAERDALATVLAYDQGRATVAGPAARSGYARLERGSTVVLVDAGPAPAMEVAGAACAGCLSFELSSGAEPLLVNGGTPGPADGANRSVARSTASHNTLCLGEQSSARLVRNARLEAEIGGPPLRGPEQVSCEVREADGAIALEAGHDGYVERFGLVHTRRLALDAAGTRLSGCDRLAAAKGVLRFAWDLPLAIHFHLHPDAEARIGPSPGTADLLLDTGEHWRLTATAASLSIEASTHFADAAGPRQSSQVVLRAQCYGAAEVSWTLERIKAGQPIDRRARRMRRAANAWPKPAPASSRRGVGRCPSLDGPADVSRRNPLSERWRSCAWVPAYAPPRLLKRLRHACCWAAIRANAARKTSQKATSMTAPASAPKIRRALISVSDKAGVASLARALAERGIEILSTGGTSRALQDTGIPVTDIATHTGFPEMMDGRLKTLHPKVHGGLLAIRGNAEHDRAAEAHGIAPIDLLVVNLYPFEATAAQGAPYEACIENIDIGGPAMIRAAAKNHASVTVVVDPEDYATVLADMGAHDGATSLELRKSLAAKAYARTAAYDAAISGWFAEALAERAPRRRVIAGRLAQQLRYGENPHQQAAFYVTGDPRPGVATAVQHQGKELSYNNLADADAALELIAEFDPRESPAVAIIKHANPCGVGLGKTLAEAYAKAFRCDPVSPFGGIIALNGTIDAATAEEITQILTEVVIAVDAGDEAKAIFAKKKNLRLLTTGGLPDPRAPGLAFRSLSGGFLVQSRDNAVVDDLALKVVTKRQPTAQELADLKFAFRVAKHVKSNAIVYAKGGATVGIGAGQMSRVDSARIAALKSQDAAKAAGESEPLTRGSVVASDAFFPFADGLLAAAEAGATAVIQPGGSLRDDEVIAAADAKGLAMVFTGVRHFRH